MITREKIKQDIQLTREMNGFLSLNFTPSKTIYDSDSVYGLYYGGCSKIEINKTSVKDPNWNYIKFNDTNFEEMVDLVYNYLKDDVSGAIQIALKNLKWEGEELKYFDRPENEWKLKLFQDEVLKNKIQYV